MIINIKVDNSLFTVAGKISKQTIININKTRSYQLPEKGVLPFEKNNFFANIKIVENLLLEENTLYLSEEVKKVYYPDVNSVIIQEFYTHIQLPSDN
jgi:hypothetical protein